MLRLIEMTLSVLIDAELSFFDVVFAFVVSGMFSFNSGVFFRNISAIFC